MSTEPDYEFIVSRSDIARIFLDEVDNEWVNDKNYEKYELRIVCRQVSTGGCKWTYEPWAYSADTSKEFAVTKTEGVTVFKLLHSVSNIGGDISNGFYNLV